MKSVKKLFDAMCKVSTKPDITSYKWARREYSILASGLLWLVWFCRLFSVYQYVKLFYRVLGERFKFGYTENLSGRPDVPPWLGELYFLSYAGLFVLLSLLGINAAWIRMVAVYYLYESALWVAYYTIFRRFFEVGYTIYHRLEYITMVFLIVPTQALCFARLYSKGFLEMFLALFGVSQGDAPILTMVFGYFLTAIIIGMIISTFPAENTKQCGKKAKMKIVGCGDVVLHRLYPAIQHSGRAVSVELFDLESAKHKTDLCKYCSDSDEIKKQLDRSSDGNSLIWIETPPHSHVPYLEHCIRSKAKLVAVEKPITADLQELAKIEELMAVPAYRGRAFFLSYYILEKALPLTYLSLLDRDEKKAKLYEPYLDTEDGSLLKNSGMLLGELKRVNICICEGKDDREWVARRELGGQLFETFLHNILIAGLFCGPLNEWEVSSFSDADYAAPVQEIALTAAWKTAEIGILMKKNDSVRSRVAEFVFENGSIRADFDQKTAEVYFALLNKTCTVSVRPEFSRNYAVQVDLVSRVFNDEIASSFADGYAGQTEAIRWLHELKHKAE